MKVLFFMVSSFSSANDAPCDKQRKRANEADKRDQKEYEEDDLPPRIKDRCRLARLAVDLCKNKLDPKDGRGEVKAKNAKRPRKHAPWNFGLQEFHFFSYE